MGPLSQKAQAFEVFIAYPKLLLFQGGWGVSLCPGKVVPLAFIGAASNSHSLRDLRLVVLQLELRWNHAEGTSTWLPGPRPTASVQWASGGA